MARFGRKAPEPEKAPELTPTLPAGWASRLTEIALTGQEAGMLDVHFEPGPPAPTTHNTRPTHDDEW